MIFNDKTAINTTNITKPKNALIFLLTISEEINSYKLKQLIRLV